MKITKLAIITGTVGIIALAIVGFSPHASAQVTFSDPLNGSLGSADLRATVISIISWALGLLALIAVVLVIYGGFVWMTAAGNEENVEKAKKIISAAVIGLIIILLAWAIVSFVGNTFNEVV